MGGESPYQLKLDPPDFIERAAVDEHWTESDRDQCQRMLEVFAETFRVARLERTELGIMAYRAAHTNWANANFTRGADKPVLYALDDLSDKLHADNRQVESAY